ncbi:MAG: hypothetical protein WCR47_01675, partial [Desulfoplanes sp.]
MLWHRSRFTRGVFSKIVVAGELQTPSSVSRYQIFLEATGIFLRTVFCPFLHPFLTGIPMIRINEIIDKAA